MKKSLSVSSRGFTALELITCIAIMTCCLGMSVVYLGGSKRRMASKGGALEVAAALRMARTEAITKRTLCAVQFYDGSVAGMGPHFHGFALYETKDKKGRSVSRWMMGPHALPPGAIFAKGGSQTFVFGPLGTIVSRGINHASLRVMAENGQHKTWHDVTVLTATGRVRIKPRESEG